MGIDRDSAQASLQEIDAVARRTRQSLIYGGASTSLILWGVLVAGGYVLTHFQLDYRGRIWTGILTVGMLGTLLSHYLRARGKSSHWDRRVTWGLLVLVAFGAYWAALIGVNRDREMGAFWPTLFMFGYVVAGFWVGRFFTICGIAVTALTIAGYLWAGPWFALWMAAVNGVGLIAGGLWLRRTGSS